MQAVVISGSRNTKGQTARAVEGLLTGLRSNAFDAQLAFLPGVKIERCRQCDQAGWGLCRSKGKCIIEDDFAALVKKIREADLAVFATPVYFSDLAESMKAFLDRLRRITRHDNGSVGISEKPAVGICVAGGGGGGAPRCCSQLDRTLATCGFDVLDMVAVRRQNLASKIEQLEIAGKWLADELKP